MCNGKPIEISVLKVENLITTIKNITSTRSTLPFAVYSSIKEQKLLNVPIAKPLLIVVLSGDKELGDIERFTCHSGDFIFLSDNPALSMRNIPKNEEYFALLIEFDHHIFDGLTLTAPSKQNYCIGKTTQMLERCLIQFVDSCLWAPEKITTMRKKEIIEMLCYLGHKQILSMVGNAKIDHRIHDMFCQQNYEELTIEYICQTLAMSESTLRRKLKAEGTSVQEIKDQARLGQGLNLLQTTHYPIGLIAQKCGYQSQSRFTERFKGRFGLTPSELRKTKMVG